MTAKDNRPIYAYIDDIIGWASQQRVAWLHYNQNRQLMCTLGLQEAAEKAVAPTTSITWIGVRFDSVSMIMSIPLEKIREVLQEIMVWLQEDTIQLQQLQKLLGHVFHVTKCCSPARLFCNRLLDGLRLAYQHGTVDISLDMRLDMFWLVAFLERFNGKHLMRSPQMVDDITVDSCLSGGGAAWGSRMCITQYSPAILHCQWHISQLEIYNVLLAIRWWQSHLDNKNIHLHCDNAVTVAVIQSGR